MFNLLIFFNYPGNFSRQCRQAVVVKQW